MSQISPNGIRQTGRGLAEGSWKGMKKYLEQEMFCSELKGRIYYHFEVYPRFSGISSCFVLLLDGKVINTFGELYAIIRLQKQGESLIGRNPDDFPMENRNTFSDVEFSKALRSYRNQPIQESINSENPIVRMSAILDRRIGKRTLVRLRNTINDQPEWLRPLYEARIFG